MRTRTPSQDPTAKPEKFSLPDYPPCPVSGLPGPIVRLFEAEEFNRLAWERAKQRVAAEERGEAITIDIKGQVRALAEQCKESPITVRMPSAVAREIAEQCRDPDPDLATDNPTGVQTKIGDS